MLISSLVDGCDKKIAGWISRLATTPRSMCETESDINLVRRNRSALVIKFVRKECKKLKSTVSKEFLIMRNVICKALCKAWGLGNEEPLGNPGNKKVKFSNMKFSKSIIFIGFTTSSSFNITVDNPSFVLCGFSWIIQQRTTKIVRKISDQKYNF